MKSIRACEKRVAGHPKPPRFPPPRPSDELGQSFPENPPLIAECEEARLLALALKQPQSAIAAIKEKGVLSGKRIERSETGEPGEFDGLNEQELAEYIGQKMAELGIEIVREEELELSVLSST